MADQVFWIKLSPRVYCGKKSLDNNYMGNKWLEQQRLGARFIGVLSMQPNSRKTELIFYILGWLNSWWPIKHVN